MYDIGCFLLTSVFLDFLIDIIYYQKIRTFYIFQTELLLSRAFGDYIYCKLVSAGKFMDKMIIKDC